VVASLNTFDYAKRSARAWKIGARPLASKARRRTLARVKHEYDERIVTVPTADGRSCNVINVRGRTPPSRPPVLLVHGAGVRANIFRAPVDETLVDYLIARGHDVWLENWRASIDFPPNEWNLDQAAVFDHPAAVRAVVAATGSSEINAVIHCQGSTSFMMSAMAGLLPQVRTVVSNAVSLHTMVPKFSWMKFKTAVPVLGYLTPYVNPHWGVHAPGALAKIMTAFVKLTHHECNNTVCKWVSFTYGAGFPALWRHENLNDETHEWLKEEFAEVPMSFFRHIGECVQHGHLVSTGLYPSLPADFAVKPPQTDARFAFFAGEKNRCFLPEGQRRSFAHFDAIRRGYHTLHTFPSYGHLDMFMGKNAAADVFPTMAQELERPLPA
jgi:pimeloyl-ACP methyl ester carboxylesterase